MSIESIINYVQSTPENTNPNILRGLLNQLSEESAPSGTINITENGTNIDVSDYAKADVNVPSSGGTLNSSILVSLTSGYEGSVANYPVIENGELKTETRVFPYSAVARQMTIPLPTSTKASPYYLKIFCTSSDYKITNVQYSGTQGETIEKYTGTSGTTSWIIIGVYTDMPSISIKYQYT